MPRNVSRRRHAFRLIHATKPERLKESYDDYTERFAYVDYPKSNHQMNPDWEQAWTRAIAWFEEHLAPT